VTRPMPPEPPVTIATRCWGEVMAFSFSNFGDASAPAGRGGARTASDAPDPRGINPAAVR
jgi:hypothetical protein